MKKKIISLLLVCILIISTSLSVAFAQVDPNVSSGTAFANNLIKVSNGYDEAFFKTQKLSIEKYNKMLNTFDENSNLAVKKGGHNYDDNYGGSFIDDNGELVVLLTNNNDDNKTKIKRYTGDNDIKTQKCSYSYNDLLEVIHTINNNLDNLSKQGVILEEMYDDVWSNQVIIAIRDLNDEKEKIVRGIIDKDFMVIKPSNNSFKNVVNVTGGNGISTSKGTSTLGFGATRNGVRGYVISGHGAALNDSVKYWGGRKFNNYRDSY